MPRLTNPDYIKQHEFLRQAWQNYDVLYSTLEPMQQWEIHHFYVPSKDWGTKELVEHRKAATASDPSLPARAGKLFSRMDAVYRQAAAASNGDPEQLHRAIAQQVPAHGRVFGKRTKPKASTKAKEKAGRRASHSIRVTSIVKPEPDVRLLARALVTMIKQEMADAGDAAPITTVSTPSVAPAPVARTQPPAAPPADSADRRRSADQLRSKTPPRRTSGPQLALDLD